MPTLRDLTIAPPFILAPMMNITGRAFRELVREYGGCGLYYSEMLNARRVRQETVSAPIFKGFAEEKDLMLQLVGDDPRILAEAVKRLEEFFPAGFDLNMGCTRTKIMKYGWGAALLTDPVRAARALAAMRQATDRPLTVKLRQAWDEQATTSFLKMLENEGVDAVILHSRTLAKRFARQAQWEWIAFAKSTTRLPVIGNGDVGSAQDALKMLHQTGCDGVMIGRAAVAQPYIFRDAVALEANGPVPAAPGPEKIVEKLVLNFGDELGSKKRTLELKTFCQFFAESLPVPHWFWGPLQGLDRGPEIAAKALSYLNRPLQTSL
jgi:nifR3 family TIM-barrel protein